MFEIQLEEANHVAVLKENQIERFSLTIFCLFWAFLNDSRRKCVGGWENELFLWLFENFLQKPVTLVHWNSKRNFESIRSTEADGYDELILDNSR